jgi:hypothetical protein
MRFILVFAGALTFTHNATSLILPGAANITTAAGDVAWVESLGSGNWRCLVYMPAGGYAKTYAEQTWTAQQIPMSGALTPAATVTWDCDTNGQVVYLDLDQDSTLSAPTNVNRHAFYTLLLYNNGGPFTITWDAAYKFPGGVDHVMTATAAALDIVTFVGGAGNILYCVGIAKGLA